MISEGQLPLLGSFCIISWQKCDFFSQKGGKAGGLSSFDRTLLIFEESFFACIHCFSFHPSSFLLPAFPLGLGELEPVISAASPQVACWSRVFLYT